MSSAARITLRVLMWFGIVLAVLAVSYALILEFFDFNRFKAPVSRLVHEKTGRELVINGDLDLAWGWPLPRIRAERVTFANPHWAREKNMFSVEKAEVAISLPWLLARRLHLTEVLVAGPVVALEIHKDGRKNWLLDREQSDEQSSIGIDRLRIDEGRLHFLDRIRSTDIQAQFTVGSESASEVSEADKKQAKGDAPRSKGERTPSGVRFTFKGRYNGVPVNARGKGGSVLAIRDENIAYPLDVSGQFAGNHVEANGTVNGLATLKAVDLKVALKGPDFATIGPLLGAPALPQTKPYQTSGRVVHHDRAWRYDQFRARLGESDLGGTLSVDQRGDRLTIEGDLQSGLLQLADFGSLIGAEEVSSARRKADQRARGKDGLFPDTPLAMERLDTLEADVRLQAKSFRAAKLPMNELDAHLTVKDRVLSLDPFNARMGGGSVLVNAKLDALKQPATGKLDARLQKVDLSDLLPEAARAKTADKVKAGRMDARLTLAGKGDSVGALLGDADGRLSLVVDGGTISNFVMEAVGLDLWEMLKFKVKGDQGITIRCGVADFAVKDGIMQARTAVLDTDDTKVTASGDIDLGREAFNLTLRPEPKDKSLVSLRSPIHIRGELSKPEIKLEKGKIAARGAGALALAAVNPLLAVLPLIETGPGLDSNCGKLIREARQSQKQPAPSAGKARGERGAR